MLSRHSIERLNVWQQQLRAAMLDHAHQLETLERRLLTSGMVHEQAKGFLASVKVCKHTLEQLERTLRLLAKVTRSNDLQVNDTSPPATIRQPVPKQAEDLAALFKEHHDSDQMTETPSHVGTRTGCGMTH